MFETSKIKSLLDTSIIFFLLSWYVTKRTLNADIEKQVTQVKDRYTMFTIMLMYILQIFYYMAVITLIFFLIVLLYKILVFDMIAHVPVETFCRDMFKFYTSKPHIIFNISLFFMLISFCFISVVFLWKDESDEQVKRNNIEFLFNLVPILYSVTYTMWIVSYFI